MIRLLNNALIGFVLLTGVAHADDPVPTPTLAPPNGGNWTKLPLTIESAHPVAPCSQASESYTNKYPVVFRGASAIKFVVAKTTFDYSSDLTITNRQGEITRVSDRITEDSREYIIAGDLAMVTWSCHSQYNDYYGFNFSEIYVSLP